jgi:hypothetical protein
MSQLSTLGEDLLLLSIRPGDGRIATTSRIGFGLMGSELIRLAASARIDIVKDRIIVRDTTPTGDAELDTALQSFTLARRPPRPKTWVGHPRRAILDTYLARLLSAGALSAEARGIFGRKRYTVTAPARLADARSRLDTIAQSEGQQVSTAEAAFGGLAHAIGLDRVLYPGFGARRVHKRLAQIGAGKWTAPGPTSTATSAATAAVDAAARASTDAATQAATQAAMDAAIQAAVQASTEAAISAAVSASADSGGAAEAHGHH